MARIFLSAKWEYLAMFNYEIDDSILQKILPPYTEIDRWEGKAIVSIVGFLFNNTKVLGIKWPGFDDFEEVNLRYYLKYFDGVEWRRGVGFVSEIVPQSLVANIANLFYNEHYSTAKMSHSIAVKDDELQVKYYWQQKKGQPNFMHLNAGSKLYDIAVGSEEEFIFEHYFGYTQSNASNTIEYSLKHPRWQVYRVNESELFCDVEQLYGSEFNPFITGVKPRSVFLARGSDVSVQLPRRIRSKPSSLNSQRIKD
jgi:uncharacterized protein YqjF (DUF2071 family)